MRRFLIQWLDKFDIWFQWIFQALVLDRFSPICEEMVQISFVDHITRFIKTDSKGQFVQTSFDVRCLCLRTKMVDERRALVYWWLLVFSAQRGFPGSVEMLYTLKLCCTAVFPITSALECQGCFDFCLGIPISPSLSLSHTSTHGELSSCDIPTEVKLQLLQNLLC